MKRNIFVWIFLILSHLSAYSQAKYDHRDSLLLEQSDSLFALGVKNYHQGKYKEAIPLFAESEKIDLSVLDSTSNRREYATIWLASCYYKLGNPERAKSIHKYYNLAPVDRRLTVRSDSLSMLGSNALDEGKFSISLYYYTEAAELEKNALGSSHVFYANTLTIISMLHSFIGDSELKTYSIFSSDREYREAIDVAQKALAIYELILESDDSDINFAKRLIKDNEEKILNQKKLRQAHSLYSQATAAMGNGAMNRAIRLGYEALEIFKEINDPNRTNNQVLELLMYCYSFLGNYNEAVRIAKDLLVIYEKSNKKSSIRCANLFVSLGSFSYALGKYADAVKYQEKAYNMRKNSRIAQFKQNDFILLGHYMCKAGNAESGIEKIKEGLCMEDINTLTRCVYAQMLTDAYYQQGDFASAISNEEQILQDLKNGNFGLSPSIINSYIASTLGKLAFLRMANGEYAAAEDYATEFLKLLENDSLIQINPLNKIGITNVSGKLINVFIKSGNVQKAKQLFMKTLKQYNQLILDYFSNLYSYTERQSFYQNKTSDWFKTLLPQYAIALQDTTINNEVYDAIMLNKGLMLNSSIEMQDFILKSEDKKVLDIYQTIKEMKQKLMSLYQSEQPNKSIIDSLEYKLSTLNLSLARSSRKYGNYTENLKKDWLDVQSKLKKGDVAIEFMCVPDSNQQTKYVAFVLTKEAPNVEMKILFDSQQLKKIINRDYYEDFDLSSLIWKPLAAYLTESGNVYFSPDGELYNIAIESLPHWDGGLVSDHWKFFRLSSTREIATKKEMNSVNKAVLYGGLKYDADLQTMVNDSKKHPEIVRSFEAGLQGIADSLALRSGVSFLPATKAEAEEIKEYINEANIQSVLYVDTAGTETSFKALSGMHVRIMHIATHGFYWTEDEVSRSSENLPDFFLSKLPEKYVEDKVMTRSGLLFSGANNTLRGKNIPIDVDDGILTAQEISSLDLSGLDLVVLSACQTGLGEIRGDGVFGLQRGFKKAGANTLLMSLWKVDDKATQLFMSYFYKNLVTGKSKQESLSEAQRDLRDYEIEKEITEDQGRRPLSAHARSQEAKKVKIKIKPYKEPRYWASFILLDAFE